MFSTSYVSGAGTSFFTCKDDYEAYCSGTARSDAKSIFALLAPYSSREYANPMDLTGHYGGNIAPLQETPEYHYATAPFYQAHWGWRSPAPDTPGRVHFDNGECTPNTLVFQVRPLKPPVRLLKFYFLERVFRGDDRTCISREGGVVVVRTRGDISRCTTRRTACTIW